MDEFSLIQHFFSAANLDSDNKYVLLGIGDDTAIIKAVQDEELLFTIDTLISGVNFPEDTDPVAIGHKSLAVNLSDIAAMGGRARWFTLALSLPDVDANWLQAFSNGLLSLAKQFDVSLVGGDTTRGPLSITISVIGTAPEGTAIRRSGARTGDSIFVTGKPGMAALGLAAIKGSLALPGTAQATFQQQLDYPQPRLLEGDFLRNYASSMIDISDGLAADLGHILAASHCGAVINRDSLTCWQTGLSTLPDSRLLDAALYGGDDYELLFSVPAGMSFSLEQDWPGSFSPLSRIGEVTEDKGIMMRDNSGKLMKITARGYNHFHD